MSWIITLNPLSVKYEEGEESTKNTSLTFRLNGEGLQTYASKSSKWSEFRTRYVLGGSDYESVYIEMFDGK